MLAMLIASLVLVITTLALRRSMDDTLSLLLALWVVGGQ